MLFSKLLIEEAGVAVAPGVGFGEYGEGYVRIGLVENEQRIRQAARNVKQFLRPVGPDAEPRAKPRAPRPAGAIGASDGEDPGASASPASARSAAAC